ncbi:LacI family DNA-binding transcriptional regulator [Achromobacter spanius]|uniref:LacI family DNA-binding transcriptional regulator n=1 Tax=Achromobacter spanius TaxID=217203 RepID=UPI003821561A
MSTVSKSHSPTQATGNARMSDVARHAGVSLVTVSRALNTPDKVSPDTLAAVRQAIDHLGYVPNLMAGGLASNRSRIIAAIVPTISNLVFAETVEALAQTLARDGYQLLLGQSGYSKDVEAALVDTFLGRRVDGLVLTGLSQPKALRLKLQRAGIPVVQTWGLPGAGPSTLIDMAVGFSNVEAGRAAARHLISRGHRTLAFLGADESRSRQRLRGLQAEALAAGLPDIEAEFVPPPVQIDAAGPCLDRMLVRRPDISAVFCNNDLLAAGLLFACGQGGLNVPGRLAVMGFGDLPISRAAFPSLSTVRIRRAEMGEQAGRMLLARLGNAAIDAKCVDLGFEIIERKST